MIFLILLLALIVLCYIYDYRGATRHKWFWYYTIMVCMILIAGLRYRIGGDTYFYILDFKKAHTLGDLSALDFDRSRYAPLWVFFTSLCKTIVPDMAFMMTVQSTIVNVAFFLFIRKHTRHVYLGLILYYCFLYLTLNMEVLREAICVSLFLFSWPYFRDGKWLAYYCFATVAFFVHISAIVLFLLPICCIPGVRWFFSYGRQTLFICAAMVVLSLLVQQYLFKFIQLIAFTDNMMDRAAVYSQNSLGTAGFNLNGAIGTIIRYALYPLVALWFLHRGKKSRRNERIDNDSQRFEMMVLISVYVTLLSTGIFIIQRYTNYFLIFGLIVIANWALSPIKMRGGKKIRIQFFYWIVILLPTLGMQTYMDLFKNFSDSGKFKGYMLYEPYSSILNPFTDANRENFIMFLKRRN